mmetsp:Transcript_18508/g.29371  ORF Transcript_18508/g.29371 Transcript_18508/m.29371 type:complete len:80 (-) Transcript_18508:200-439(-)
MVKAEEVLIEMMAIAVDKQPIATLPVSRHSQLQSGGGTIVLEDGAGVGVCFGDRDVDGVPADGVPLVNVDSVGVLGTTT